MSSVPRDPSAYSPTTHAKQMRRERGIDWDTVGETIQDGTCHYSDADVEHQREFIKRFPYYDHPVGVVVDITDREVVTVEFRK